MQLAIRSRGLVPQKKYGLKNKIIESSELKPISNPTVRVVIPDAEIQEITLLASLPGGGKTQRYSDGGNGNQWEQRVQTVTDEEGTREPDSNRAAYVTVSSSARNGVVGLGTAIKTRKRVGDDPTVETLFSTLGPRTEQNPYAAELAAIAHAL
jgi:hypothetical protein